MVSIESETPDDGSEYRRTVLNDDPGFVDSGSYRLELPELGMADELRIDAADLEPIETGENLSDSFVADTMLPVTDVPEEENMTGPDYEDEEYENQQYPGSSYQRHEGYEYPEIENPVTGTGFELEDLEDLKDELENSSMEIEQFDEGDIESVLESIQEIIEEREKELNVEDILEKRLEELREKSAE